MIGTFKHDRTYGEYRLSSLRVGVSAEQVGELPVLIQKTADGVAAYTAALSRDEPLVVCGRDVVDSNTGRHFPVTGDGLQRVRTEVVDGILRVYPADISPAAPGTPVFTPRLLGNWQDRALHPAPAACR